MAQVFGGGKRRYKVKDFLPSWWDDQVEEANEDGAKRQIQTLMEMARADDQ
jgi:hypothetical protein